MLTGEVHVATAQGVETWYLEIGDWSFYFALSASHGFGARMFRERLAPFAEPGGPIMTIDAVGRLFFQSGASGCVGNGTLTPHADGRFYVFLNTVHALTVILGLMYLPFGKLFHIFQRPGNLGVAYYKRAAEAGPPQICARCGDPFASALQMGDLKDVLPLVGFDYSLPEGGNYQDHCPACRRRLVTPHSVLLFHPMKWQSEEHVIIAEAAEWARHFEHLEKDMDELLARQFGVPLEKLKPWLHPGRYVLGKEMVAAGLATMIDLAPLPELVG